MAYRVLHSEQRDNETSSSSKNAARRWTGTPHEIIRRQKVEKTMKETSLHSVTNNQR